MTKAAGRTTEGTQDKRIRSALFYDPGSLGEHVHAESGDRGPEPRNASVEKMMDIRIVKLNTDKTRKMIGSETL
jgi:hypothetical protein